MKEKNYHKDSQRRLDAVKAQSSKGGYKKSYSAKNDRNSDYKGEKSFGRSEKKYGSKPEKKSYDKKPFVKNDKYEKKEKTYTSGDRFERSNAKREFGKYAGDKYAEKSSYRADFRETDQELNPNLLIGRNPVTEALKSGRTIDKVLMQKDAEGSAKKIASMARERKVQLQYVDKIVLDNLCPGRPHQGVAAYVAAHDYSDIEHILDAAEAKGEDALVVVLDGLEDPHNLGAVLRSCDGAGAHGVVIPSRRSVTLTETVAKASAGAIEYVPVAKVINIASAVDELKARGLWVVAVDMDGENYTDAQLSGPLALVVGGEGQGVSRLVKEKCDFTVSIPMKGKVNSLNASNAAAILLYEAVRQRG